MKFKEVSTPTYVNVRDLQAPFEGLYQGKVEGKHGSNYLFKREDQNFVIYGIKSVHEKMSSIDPGLTVRITKIAEHQNQGGGVFVEVRIEVEESTDTQNN